jgi:predicted nucleotidyltransferase
LALLFGSYAKGLEKDDSDSDLYIETKSKKTKEELESSDTRLSIKIGDYNQQSSLAKEIEKNHVIIKGVERYYEKTGFFNKN